MARLGLSADRARAKLAQAARAMDVSLVVAAAIVLETTQRSEPRSAAEPAIVIDFRPGSGC
jgi:hypothetical protein